MSTEALMRIPLSDIRDSFWSTEGLRFTQTSTPQKSLRRKAYGYYTKVHIRVCFVSLGSGAVGLLTHVPNRDVSDAKIQGNKDVNKAEVKSTFTNTQLSLEPERSQATSVEVKNLHARLNVEIEQLTCRSITSMHMTY